MHVHPGNGNSTLHSMLSVGFFTATKLRVYACASRKRKIYFTFYAFIGSLQQQSYTFMHMHPDNGKSTLHSMLSYLFLQQQNHAFMHVYPGNRKSILLSLL